MNGQKLIVMSADALVSEDIEHLKSLPNFKKYLAGGARVDQIRSIYPSVTYPCHVTMSTGVYPNKHGVISNFDMQINESPMPWTWFHKFIKTDDIFSAAKRAGLTTSAVFWPVTGKHPDIDYLIAEYWTQGVGDDLLSAFKRVGSSPEVLEIIEKNRNILVERKHPMCDDFIVACTCDIIRNHQPDLLMLHPANIDAYRHSFGLFNDKVTAGIDETDRWIGQIMEAVADTGNLENTSLVLTSDHGQMDVRRIININVLLTQCGLIKIGTDGLVSDWDAYCLSNGLSALIFLKDKDDPILHNNVSHLLHEWLDEGIYGIGKVFTEEETNLAEHLGGEFSFVLETDNVSAFGSACTGSLSTTHDITDYRYGKATHGHLPQKGPQPTFIAKGPGFANGSNIKLAHLVDQAPTYAALLGLELKNADGRIMTELLKNREIPNID